MVMNLKVKTTLAIYCILILSMLTILVCTEDNLFFSISIAVICTSTGVLGGQIIKRRVQVLKSRIGFLIGLFIVSFLLSIGIHYYVAKEIELIYIVLTNVVLALVALWYFYFFKQGLND